MNKTPKEKKVIIESLLFVSSGSVPMDQLEKFLDIKRSELNDLVAEMNQEYQNRHGLCIMKNRNRLQLITDPQLGEIVEEFLGLEIKTSLSRAALEAVAIIAYRQPITRPQIEEVRGVNSDGVVRTLLSKGLIQELGRSDSIGKPILYGTSEDFLHYFGLKSLEELPKIEKQIESGGITQNQILKQ